METEGGRKTKMRTKMPPSHCKWGMKKSSSSYLRDEKVNFLYFETTVVANEDFYHRSYKLNIIMYFMFSYFIEFVKKYKTFCMFTETNTITLIMDKTTTTTSHTNDRLIHKKHQSQRLSSS